MGQWFWPRPRVTKVYAETRASSLGTHASRLAGLASCLDEVRRLGRARRLRFQLPLAIAGGTIGLGSLCASLALQWIVLGGMGIALGPWLLLLCIMANDARAIAIAISLGVLLMAASCFLMAQQAFAPCNARLSERSCLTVHVLSYYSMIVLFLHAIYALRLEWKLLRGSLPARAALERMWQCVGSLMLLFSGPWFGFGYERLREAVNEFQNGQQYHGAERVRSNETQAIVRFVLGFELVLLGALALWPKLRTTVQAKLASIGEGVAAAAGISEMLGHSPTQALIAFAEETLRSVRVEQLELGHFNGYLSAYEAYELSAPAQLGSIDAFVSHSWHDSAQETLNALREWRRAFVQQHGREPTVWLDKCCLHPECVPQQLSCLPVFCAACDSMVALRGATYLSRMWCVIELYVFYEMQADASRIQIIDLKDAPTYTAEGVLAAHGDAAAAHSLLLRALHRAAPQHQCFDVRQATCSERADLDRLLTVIESVGNGFGNFNAWMHDMLVTRTSRSAEWRVAATHVLDAPRSSTTSAPRASSFRGDIVLDR